MIEEQRYSTAPLLPLVETWLAEGNRLDSLTPSLTKMLWRLRNGQQETVTLDQADRLLCALDQPAFLNELCPPERRGRGGYTWSKPHPSRRLSERQVLAAHKLHWDGGLSIRELGRRLWQPLGYASAHSCAAALSQAFIRDGLPRRERLEAVRQVNDGRGYVRGRDRNEYRRTKRAELRASSPEFRAEERARLDQLHAREKEAS